MKRNFLLTYMINNQQKALILCNETSGAERIIRYFYFCEFVWKFSEVKISDKFDENYSKLIIIDRNFIKNFEIKNNYKNFKFLICLWNGMFDFEQEEIQLFAKQLENLKIEFNFFLIGYNPNYEKNNIFLYPGNEILKNDKVIIKSKLKYKIMYKYSNIYYLIRSFKHPFKFFINIFQKKIIFVGGGLLTDNYINKLMRSNYHNKVNKVLKRFFIFSKKSNLKDNLLFIKELINTEEFSNLMSHEKLFLIHRIYRHILFSLLNEFKNFKFYLREYKLGIVRSDLFRKNYFLDLGSTVGLGLYDRTIQLYKHHKNKTIKLEFFNKDLNYEESIVKFEKKAKSLYFYKDKNISAEKLKTLVLND